MEEGEAAGGTPGSGRMPGGREDCWSEGATLALIKAWGDRYLELNRGNLKQKHWQEVAEAVNERTGGGRARKTDIQCKNRMDTLKKKYKVERARVSATNGAFVSKWPYYIRIDGLIGPAASSKKGSPVRVPKSEPPMALPLPYRTASVPVVAVRAAAAAAAGREKRPAEDDYVLRRIPGSDTQSGSSRSKTSPDSAESSRESRERGGGRGGSGSGNVNGSASGSGGGLRELARAIMRFGEIYEKVEAAKQRQMMDLERQRMEFVKGLEFQRMQIFMDSQVELAKLKKAKRASAGE